VLSVIAQFVRPKKLSEFNVQKQRLEVFDPSSPQGAGYKAFYSAKEGFIVNTYKGEVIQLVFLPTKREQQRCPDYYSDPKGFVAVGLIP
jgi:hypothetical protein